MPRFFHPLLMMLASATHRDLVVQIQYLKTEVETLRTKLPKRVSLSERERRRLVKLGGKVGPALRHLISIVSYRTFQRWAVAGRKSKSAPRTKRKPGRPRMPEEIRELVLRIAGEMNCGYTRVLGELKKLGIRNISKTTVRNILKEAGFDPDSKRGKGSWDEFVKIHAKTLWACDFISKKVWTLGGLVDYFILFFINIETRQVIISAATPHPTNEWVTQQARNFIMEVEDTGRQVTDLIHDWDTKFTNQFDAILESDDVRIHKLGPAKPNLNAYAERWCQSLQVECLDNFIVLGEKHLNHIISEYLTHYHEERPHQSLGNAPPMGMPSPGDGEVACCERLGGLLKHYYRRAA